MSNIEREIQKVDITASSVPITADVGVSIGDNWAPNIPYTEVSTGKLITDPDNQLITRGTVLTDEGTFRDDFNGTSIDTSVWTTTNIGNGSLTVSNSFINLGSGTQNNNVVAILTEGDYGPISFRTQFSLSARNNQQNVDLGFKDLLTNENIGAFFRFDGTNNATVKCISKSFNSSSATQTTTIIIPNGTSATSNDYYVEVQPDQVSFIINGIQVAQHRLHIPAPYDVLNFGAIINNTATTGATTLSIDYIYFINQDSLQINNSFIGDELPVRIRSGTQQTYAAAIQNFVAANSATDIFTITGSATKTIRIKHLSVDATQSNASIISVQLLRRSTANTGGTSTVLTSVPFDSINSPATAVVRAYTANPTLGTLVGAIHTEKLLIPRVTDTAVDSLEFEVNPDDNTQAVTLRGINEVLAVNLNGVTVGGNSFNIDITWIEE